LFFAAFTTSNAQTTVSSIISSNQTWTASGSPYLVTANVLVQTGVKVTIEPGTQIKATGDRLRIIVDGELVAIGKKDSAIVSDSVSYEFTDKCAGYDTATGLGSQFQYVLFRGVGQGGNKTIDLKSTSMLVRNCRFLEGYYYIYSYASAGSLGDTTNLIIEKSIFQGTSNYPQGYMVYTSGNTQLNISDCIAEDIGGITISKWTTIRKSAFKNFGYSSGFRQSSGQKLILECNLFQNFRYTLLDLTYPGNGAVIEVRENTFDSSEVLLKLRGGSTFKPKSMVIENNNFLNFKVNSVQVSVGNNPGNADTLNLRKNYWGTTTKADIEAGIKDFKDDITIEGLVDFSGYLSSQVKTCTGGGTIGGADTSSANASVTTFTSRNISMYPNPANSSIQLNSDGAIITAIRILDLNGQVKSRESVLSASPSVRVDMLAGGIYIIEAEGDNFLSRSKLIIKH